MTFKHKLAHRLALLRALAAVAVAGLAVLWVASCEKPLTVSEPNPSVAQLVVSPKVVTLQENQVQDFMAVGFTTTGDSAQIGVTWSVTGGTIDTSSSGKRHYGHYKNASCGSFKVVATSHPGSKTDTAAVAVTCPVPVASVSVAPATATVPVGQTLQLSATPQDANGSPLSGRTIAWSSDNATVATVSASGVVTAKGAGSARITATSEGQSGTSSITVTTVPVASVSVSPASASVPQGATVQLTATPQDANGTPLTGRTISWVSGTTSVATVDGSGRVTGVTAGSAIITATSEGKSGTSNITVTVAPVASVSVSPASASVSVNQTVQLTATPKDANGTPLSGRTISWVSGTTGVATVDGSGLVTGVTAGSATITATSEGKTGSATVIVTSGSGTTVTLVGAGDIAECGDDTDDSTAALLGRIGGTVFTVGDNAYPDGYYQDYANCWAPSWGKYQAIVHPAAGNHEYHDITSSGGDDYYRYFYRDHGTIVGDSDKFYYSYDLGAWHMVVLNTVIDMSAGSPQEQWLRADLAASTKRCTVAYMHYPRFSSGANHGSDADVQPLWQALYDYGAEIAIAGHDHEYERFAPQTPDGQLDTQRGIRSFVVGTGGGGLYSFATPLPNSEVRNSSTWGVLALTLGDGTYSWQFVPITGQTFTDSGSGTCH